MDEVKVGDVLKIQCYKHNGQIYRNWDEAIVLEINPSYIVCANNKARVTEIDGRKWHTKEPAVIFFYKDRWFNIISQFKKKEYIIIVISQRHMLSKRKQLNI